MTTNEDASTGDQQLDEFLVSCRCQRYVPAFRDADAVYSDLPTLITIPDELEELIPRCLPRRRFVNAVHAAFCLSEPESSFLESSQVSGRGRGVTPSRGRGRHRGGIPPAPPGDHGRGRGRRGRSRGRGGHAGGRGRGVAAQKQRPVSASWTSSRALGHFQDFVPSSAEDDRSGSRPLSARGVPLPGMGGGRGRESRGFGRGRRRRSEGGSRGWGRGGGGGRAATLQKKPQLNSAGAAGPRHPAPPPPLTNVVSTRVQSATSVPVFADTSSTRKQSVTSVPISADTSSARKQSVTTFAVSAETSSTRKQSTTSVPISTDPSLTRKQSVTTVPVSAETPNIPSIPLHCQYAQTNWKFAMRPEETIGAGLNEYPHAFDHSRTVCYCAECYDQSEKSMITHGSKHGIPLGWTRFGLSVKGMDIDSGCFDSWLIGYHGTSCESASTIIRTGCELLMPDDRTQSGVRLSVPDGHIADEEWRRQIFVTPSIIYASMFVYAKRDLDIRTGNVHQMVFEVRVKPNRSLIGSAQRGDVVFKISPETVGATQEGVRLDPSFSNSELEWRTDRRNAIVISAVLVRCFPGKVMATMREGKKQIRAGQFNQQDDLHGFGFWSWKGKSYFGEYRNNKQHGFGRYNWADGDRYEGEWRGNVRHGHGVMIDADGERYEGEFRKNVENGFGVKIYIDGSRYEGDWLDGLRHGHGVYSLGRVKYEGGFHKHKYHGHGTYTYASGKKFVGEFRENIWHGKGVLTFPDGARFEGEWVDGKKHGKGQYTDPSGTMTLQLWEHGKEVARKTGMVLFDFAASDDEEISVSKGDTVHLLALAEAWAFVQKADSEESGYVPAAYVRFD